MNLFLDELGHLSLYLLVALPIGWWLQKRWGVIVCTKDILIGLFTTLFIDVDHLLDYFLWKGPGFVLIEFLSGGFFEESGKVIVFLHSWELTSLLFLIFFFLKNKTKYSWILFVALAFLVHITFDVLSYGFDPSVYFLIRRILHKFSNTIFHV